MQKKVEVSSNRIKRLKQQKIKKNKMDKIVDGIDAIDRGAGQILSKIGKLIVKGF